MSSESMYLSFKLGEAVFCIDVLLVREVIHNFEPTPVETAPDFVLGLINLRGQIVTVLNAATRVGKWSESQGGFSHCLILKTPQELPPDAREKYGDILPEETTAIAVDGIGEVKEAGQSKMEPVPANLSDVREEYVMGVIKLDSGLMMLLDIGKVLAVKSTR